jgi:hypothetical protein
MPTTVLTEMKNLPEQLHAALRSKMLMRGTIWHNPNDRLGNAIGERRLHVQH